MTSTHRMKLTYITKTDLALAYFPHLTPDSARHKLISIISEQGSRIRERLLSVDYRASQKEFSPAQVSIIVEHLGSPY